MIKTKLSLTILGLAAALVAGPALAAGGNTKLPERQPWSFAGPFGTFDRAQLQRGFQVYREVCANCHSLKRVAFRNLSEAGGPQFSEAQIKALAAEHGVPLVENKPVARMLFKVGKVGKPIPLELYQAVADILAFVYKTHRYYFHRLKERRSAA
jgi:type III secretion system FlhB-like substrate exporter